VKILLVDDSALMLGYLAQLLTAHGQSVTVAGSAQAALESAAKSRPDAILMDFVLEPGRTGLETLSVIFSLLGDPRPRAAILTQGGLAPADAKRAAGQGITILQKPVRGQEAEFLRAIDAWIC
jgi:CheY-like chemotaxis protein